MGGSYSKCGECGSRATCGGGNDRDNGCAAARCGGCSNGNGDGDGDSKSSSAACNLSDGRLYCA